MTSSPAPASAPVDAVARQLVGALLCTLTLVLPVYGALSASSAGPVALSLIGAAVLAVLVGRVLEAAGVPRAFATCLVAAGAYAVLTLLALTIAALLWDLPGDSALALVVGVPVAAVAAAIAVAVVARFIDDRVVMVVSIGGFFAALVTAQAVGGLVHDAQDVAASRGEGGASAAETLVWD
ncbi:hypothetical protein LRP67_11135 [Nocardioides sp. cx-169]|uniref:hypothetical protein n=1 Tax=Nocardioides sp. cx-169 TaxID=2899080 RepID=UPI001E290EB2|nr:hypothetical protein [Nocardioides sp. cx-169]MCD4534636.1 hypothetical protein [Nocardioides sp. cx-169]